MSSVILWFRRDLRLDDQPALEAACKLKVPVIPVFIWSPEEESPWAPGEATRVWLNSSLKALDKNLRDRGSRLIIRKGKAHQELKRLISETKAQFVFWNRLYDPTLKARDEEIKDDFKKSQIDAKSFNSHLLFEPWTLQTKSKTPFQVFTPFSNTCAKLEIEAPQNSPKTWQSPKNWPTSLKLEELKLLPRLDWGKKILSYWQPGEDGALHNFKAFAPKIAAYKLDRDFPILEASSRLSPHLHFGEISPRRIWQSTNKLKSADWFRREILWREFAHHILFHFPSTQDSPLRTSFDNFGWLENKKTLASWQNAETGYPIVDAGMRELWETGWMHNRVRMIVASFLTKHLLTNWLSGAKWFWQTLVDADLANNSLGWQWAGGCGADAAPYFRIFNPVLQGEKFDADGAYVRKWIPELKDLENKFIHKPWEANLKLKYPSPIVNHAEARARALKAFSATRK